MSKLIESVELDFEDLIEKLRSECSKNLGMGTVLTILQNGGGQISYPRVDDKESVEIFCDTDEDLLIELATL